MTCQYTVDDVLHADLRTHTEPDLDDKVMALQEYLQVALEALAAYRMVDHMKGPAANGD